MKFLTITLGLLISSQAMAGSYGFASLESDAEYYIKPNMVLLAEFLKDDKRNTQPVEFCAVAKRAYDSMDALFLIPNGSEKEKTFARAYGFLEKAQCEDGIPETISLEAETNLLAAFFELNKFWSVDVEASASKAEASPEVESAQVEVKN